MEQRTKLETPIAPGDILTPTQLAERLQVGVSWVYEKCGSRGGHDRMPVLRAGRYLRFSWTAVCRWLQREQTP